MQYRLCSLLVVYAATAIVTFAVVHVAEAVVDTFRAILTVVAALLRLA